MMKKLTVVLGYLIVFLLLSGCGVSDKSLNNAEKRINDLVAKGVPDSSLSRPKVYLYQARDSKQRNEMALAREAARNLRTTLAEAESKYNEDVARIKSWLETQRQAIAKEVGGLTGLNRKSADSCLRIVDSFTTINWLLQAEDQTKKLLDAVPRYKLNEQVGNEIRGKIPGSWVCTNISKHSEDKTVNAVEKKIFSFTKDGKAALIESKLGKSTPTFKEDWEFDSWGTWDVKGDTIFLFINRFKAAKQDVVEQHERNGKKVWEKKTGPTYDSAIVDGSQDRFIVYQDLLADFTRK